MDKWRVKGGFGRMQGVGGSPHVLVRMSEVRVPLPPTPDAVISWLCKMILGVRFSVIFQPSSQLGVGTAGLGSAFEVQGRI